MITEKHIEWLTKANAGNYSEKQLWFYPFKERLLRKCGIPDGYDKQVLQKVCYRCRGTGEFVSLCRVCVYMGDCRNCRYVDSDEEADEKANRCPRCGGTGFYSNQTHYLLRFRLRDKVFHIPAHGTDANPFDGKPPVNVYTQLLKHIAVTPQEARVSMRKLFLWFDLKTCIRYERNRLWQKRAGIIRTYRERIQTLFSLRAKENSEPF